MYDIRGFPGCEDLPCELVVYDTM